MYSNAPVGGPYGGQRGEVADRVFRFYSEWVEDITRRVVCIG